MHIYEMDHIVLNVADIDRSLEFYIDQLGLAGVRVEEWRRGEVFFPSVRISDGCIIDFFNPPPGAQPAGEMPVGGGNLNHFCMVADRATIDEIVADDRFTVSDGPGPRFGARGDGWSVYIDDPDGNIVEIRSYD